MNILAAILGIGIIVTGTWYVYSRNNLLERASTIPISVDLTQCTSAPGAYVCPKSSLSPFTEIAVLDTATEHVCVLSYNGTTFDFTGKKNTQIPAGTLAVSVHPDKKIATIVQTGADTISLTLDTTGRPVFLMRVGADFSREQCLFVPQ